MSECIGGGGGGEIPLVLLTSLACSSETEIFTYSFVMSGFNKLICTGYEFWLTAIFMNEVHRLLINPSTLGDLFIVVFFNEFSHSNFVCAIMSISLLLSQ